MGLGLFISKQIVNKFNGTLNFISKYAVGSAFYFTFDLEQNSDQESSKSED